MDRPWDQEEKIVCADCGTEVEAVEAIPLVLGSDDVVPVCGWCLARRKELDGLLP
jgi:hypothetical protein